MFLRNILSFFLCIALWINNLLPSIVAGTLIKTPAGYRTAENITIGDTLRTYDHTSLSAVTVTHITKKTTNIIVAITTKKGCFYASPDQLFYDPTTTQWTAAKSITINTILLNSNLDDCTCLSVATISVPPTDVYHISTTAPHTFFVTEQELLTHNAFPVIVIGIAWLFGEGLKFAGLSLGAAALGSYVGINLYNKNKHAKAEFDISIQVDTFGGYNPDPDDDENNDRKFNTITKSEFFKKVKNDYEHYKNGIYRRKKGARGLDKAEYLEWDHLHGDVEAYAGNRWHMGSIDPKNLKFYKPAVAGRTLPR